MGQLVINASIPFGASARIGYRVPSTSAPFVYHSQYPGYNDFPYTIDSVPLGTYEVEITVICPNCSGSMYSEPVVVQAISM